MLVGVRREVKEVGGIIFREKFGYAPAFCTPAPAKIIGCIIAATNSIDSIGKFQEWG
jgi:hypothetical protein